MEGKVRRHNKKHSMTHPTTTHGSRGAKKISTVEVEDKPVTPTDEDEDKRTIKKHDNEILMALPRTEIHNGHVVHFTKQRRELVGMDSETRAQADLYDAEYRREKRLLEIAEEEQAAAERLAKAQLVQEKEVSDSMKRFQEAQKYFDTNPHLNPKAKDDDQQAAVVDGAF